MFSLDIKTENRIQGLDLARALAICLVVFAHSIWISNHYPLTIAWFMKLSGTIGVEVFFVISGFLIGSIISKLINQENFGLQTILVFLKRRWFRTLPSYYLVLFLNIILWYVVYKQFPVKLGLYFFYLQNLFSTSPAFFRIAWSLAVEQFCYIIAPSLIFLAVKIFPNRDKNQLFLCISIFVILIFTLVRVHFHFTNSLTSIFEWNESIRKVTIYRVDAIFYGFVLYLISRKNLLNQKYVKHFFVFGLFLTFILHIFIFAVGFSYQNSSFFFDVLFLPINSFAVCLTIPFLTQYKIPSAVVLKFVTYLSVISYSIYLLHYTIILHILKIVIPSENLVGLHLFQYTIGYWIIVLLLSTLQYKYFEKPLTNFRNKFA